MVLRTPQVLIDRFKVLRSEGKSFPEIAEELGITLSSTHGMATNYHLYGLGPPSFWNDGRKARAIQMAKDGYSASQIASDLGCSRNAVIGRLHRSRITWKRVTRPDGWMPKKSRPRPPKGQQRASDIIQPKVVEERMCDLEVEPSPKTWVFFVDRQPNECCWPSAGEPGPRMRVCGAEIPAEWIGFRSYCPFHHEKSRVGGRVR